jgi:glycerophosphoryl diester phosphodiesterase
MKHLVLSFLCLASLTVAAQQIRPVDAIIGEFYHHPEHVMVAAHRAAHTKYPENSLAAVQEAIDQGIDIAEIDVQETKDHVLIIMHDDNITRATGKTGKIIDYTYAELLQFPLLFNGQPTKEKIPTFEELLQLTKGKIMVDVDFKADSPAAAKQAVAMIAAHKMEDQVLFFIYEHPFATQLREWNPALPIMPRAHNVGEVGEILQMGKFPVIHIDDSFYADSLMQRITRSGTRIWINALGKYDKLEEQQADSGFDQRLTDAKYANAIQTNFPEKLLAYLRKKGLHQ